jgi:hypothetical protein
VPDEANLVASVRVEVSERVPVVQDVGGERIVAPRLLDREVEVAEFSVVDALSFSGFILFVLWVYSGVATDLIETGHPRLASTAVCS